MITVKEIIEIIEAESVQENSNSNNRVLIHQDFEYVAEQIVKKLTLTDVTYSAEDAITLFNFYAEKSCESIKGQLIPVRKEYLEQYKTMENWLKERHKHYR